MFEHKEFLEIQQEEFSAFPDNRNPHRTKKLD